MDLTPWASRLPAILVLVQLPWFIVLSVVRVRLGGTGALLIVKCVDLLMPLPAVAGLLIAARWLWHAGGHGGIGLWGGGLACALVVGLFAWLLFNR